VQVLQPRPMLCRSSASRLELLHGIWQFRRCVINATIKSGTNAYHGNLFEYLRTLR